METATTAWETIKEEEKPAVEVEVEDTVAEEKGGEAEQASSIVWPFVLIGKYLQVHFPEIPFKKTTFVEFGAKDFTVEAFTRSSPHTGLNFIVTRRVFTVDEGQLKDDAMYAYVLDQIFQHRRFNLIAESHKMIGNVNFKEYELSRGIRFYRLQMFRVNDSFYQCLVKGKRRSVHDPESDWFFNHIKILE